MFTAKQLVGWVRRNWKKLILAGGVIVIAFLLVLYKLGSLVHGVSDQELAQRAFAGNWHHIARNPLGAPLSVLQWLIMTISGHQGQTALRLASVILGLCTLAAMSYVFRRWYGRRAAVYGTILFASCAWFLHVSRYDGTDVLYLWAIPTLLAGQIMWERRQHSPLSTLLLAVLVAALLYIPGMLWIVIISFSLQPAQVIGAWRRLNNWQLRTALPATIIILLLPLLLAISHDSGLWLNWLGFPNTISPTNIPRNLVHAVSFFVFRGPATPELWLDRLPILTFFSLVMMVLGAIFYIRYAGNARTRTLIGMFIAGAVFYAVQGPVAFSIIVPIVYLLVAAGIGYFLHQWLKVFPRNPLARGVGYGLLALTMSTAVVYNLRAYYIAWPHNQTTQVVFHNRL